MSTNTQTNLSTPVTETLNRRVSVRAFQNKPVSDEMLNAVLTAARRSPTSSNMQTYSIVVVRDPETKKQLSVLAGNQQHIIDCDVFLGFCADINRLGIAVEMHGEALAKSLETTLVSSVDAALVGMSAQIAAESFGLGAVMIGGMRNHPQEAAELLGFPQGVYIVYGMSLGWPAWDDVPPQKPRLPAELVIHREQYSQDDPRPLVREYDEALAAYYGQQNRNQHQAAWSGPIARRLNSPRRPFLKATLEKMGFTLD